MTKRINRRDFLGGAAISSLPLIAGFSPAATRHFATPETVVADRSPSAISAAAMDDDLLEVTVAKLHRLYDARKYTVSQVTHWYLDRIKRYNPVYRALIHVDTRGALATAAALDGKGKAGASGALWGVPIVIKSNTSVQGLVTSAGWYGYLVPGLELIAPKDAHVVAKLRAAGAVILAQTNMPDFAASDTNFSTAYGRTGNAYNVRYSPGGSSGGTVTAVTANLCVLGTGTDTANSIRMPAATSSVVGILPTRGLVSIAGIQPLDWLRDNTGPIARTTADAVLALDVMTGEDPLDFRTKGTASLRQSGPYVKYLNPRSLNGKRFGVPAFMMDAPGASGSPGGTPLQPETRAAFMKALDGLRSAGATVVLDDTLLDASFNDVLRTMSTRPWVGEGTEIFLREFGPKYYHSTAEYAIAVGAQMPATVRGATDAGGRGRAGDAPAPAPQPARPVASDPTAESTLWEPQRRALAAYEAALDKFHLDGLVYPAIQMPPTDEIAELTAGGRIGGPHSKTGWVNEICVPAVSVPAGFYESGLPFNIEFSARRWRDGDLLGWVFAYEQATKARRPPQLRA
ncbi:MAG: amidase [Gemmatimonadaceae bacterium]